MLLRVPVESKEIATHYPFIPRYLFILRFYLSQRNTAVTTKLLLIFTKHRIRIMRRTQRNLRNCDLLRNPYP